MKDIKPGYMLQIETWENDRDNYNTVTFTGLNKDEVEFYIRVASLFYSVNSKYQGFGNTSDEDEEIANEIDSIIEEFKNNKSIPIDWLDTEDEYYVDCLNDLIGRWNEGEYWRVFDNYKVYEVPVVIKDVTEEFSL